MTRAGLAGTRLHAASSRLKLHTRILSATISSQISKLDRIPFSCPPDTLAPRPGRRRRRRRPVRHRLPSPSGRALGRARAARRRPRRRSRCRRATRPRRWPAASIRCDKHGSSGSASSARPGTRSPTTRRASSASPASRLSSRSGRSGRTSARHLRCSPRRTICSSTAPSDARSGRTRSTLPAGNGSCVCERALATVSGRTSCSPSSATSSATTTSCVDALSACVPQRTSSACGTRRRPIRAPSSVSATPSGVCSASTLPQTWITSPTTIH